MNDEKIVELYWNRDESAISETDSKYGAYLTKIAYNILADHEDSKESVNDTYLAAWNSIPPQKPNVLGTYLAKLTRRCSVDIFRKRTREKRRASEYAASLSELEEVISGDLSLEETVEAQVLADAIGSFLRALPDEARRVFVGRYYYLDSVRDVASYCGISESKAKSLLHRTRIRLREYLKKEGFTV